MKKEVMSQAEVTRRLHRLHFGDKWSKARLAKEAGISRPLIDDALDGKMSATTQMRLASMMAVLPKSPPKQEKGFGKKRRFLMRLFNLKRWISEIEFFTGTKKFKDHKYKNLTKEEAGYICTKLDYQLKWYLLHTFGTKLKEQKVFLGDCYSAEQWIKRIKVVLPREKEELMKALLRRGK